MPVFYCPKCWKEFKDEIRNCPFCGFNLDEFDRLSYEDKLITALSHPVADYRINAIKILGTLKSEKAVEKFEEMLDREDILTILEIVDVLGKIKSKKAKKILERLKKSRSKVVSERAENVLDEMNSID